MIMFFYGCNQCCTKYTSVTCVKLKYLFKILPDDLFSEFNNLEKRKSF